MSERPATNKAVVRRFFEEILGAGRLDRLPDLVADDAADETAVGPGGHGTRDDFARHVERVRAAVGELRITVTELLAEDDRVVAYWTMEGVQRGELFGVAPTGRRFTGRSVSRIVLHDGRVVRYAVLADALGIVRQLTA